MDESVIKPEIWSVARIKSTQENMPDSHSSTRSKLALVFQALIVFLALSGIAVSVWNAPTASSRLNTFSYYTIQSNLLVAAAMLLGMHCRLAGFPEPKVVVVFKSGALLWILVTGIVFSLLLADRWQPQGAMAYVNLTLHYATPAGMVLNWVLFERKGQYQLAYLLPWLAYPLAYALGSLIRGALTGIYPYWFLNPSAPYPRGTGSIASMFVVVGVITLGFLLIGLLILLFDRLAERKGTG
jgi:hypothetical protein